MAPLPNMVLAGSRLHLEPAAAATGNSNTSRGSSSGGRRLGAAGGGSSCSAGPSIRRTQLTPPRRRPFLECRLRAAPLLTGHGRLRSAAHRLSSAARGRDWRRRGGGGRSGRPMVERPRPMGGAVPSAPQAVGRQRRVTPSPSTGTVVQGCCCCARGCGCAGDDHLLFSTWYPRRVAAAHRCRCGCSHIP